MVNFLHDEGEAVSAADAIHDAGGEALVIRTDVRDAAAVDFLIQETVHRWGPVDVFVNTSSMLKPVISFQTTCTIERTSAAAWLSSETSPELFGSPSETLCFALPTSSMRSVFG